MNIGGGEATDQMVRMLLSGTEVVIRLSGSALKNLLALTLALARNHKKLSGKVNLGKMLRETRDLRQFSMTPAKLQLGSSFLLGSSVSVCIRFLCSFLFRCSISVSITLHFVPVSTGKVRECNGSAIVVH